LIPWGIRRRGPHGISGTTADSPANWARKRHTLSMIYASGAKSSPGGRGEAYRTLSYQIGSPVAGFIPVTQG
jgi:hypothetical protein